MSISVVAGFSGEWPELDATIENLERLGDLLDEWADIGVELAQQYVRVRSGLLRSTIRRRLVGILQMEITAGEGLTDSRAGANEYGTSSMIAQPYLRPAMEQIRAPFLADVRALFGGR